MLAMAENTKSPQQKAAEEYLSKFKLKEIFQGLLRNVICNQPDDPIAYFHEEITRIKQEMEESNVDIGCTTFLTSGRPSSLKKQLADSSTRDSTTS